MNLHKEKAQERPTNIMPYTAVQNTQNVNSFFQPTTSNYSHHSLTTTTCDY